MKKEDLDNILALQAVDAEIDRIKASKQKMPEDIEEVENLLSDRKAQSEHAKAKIEELEKQKSALEIEIKTEEDRIRKDKGKLMQVKSNNEYHALLREIDNSKREISDKETLIIKLMEEIDEKKELTEQLTSGLENLEKEIVERKKEFEEFLKDAQKNIEGKESLRKEYLEKIDKSLLRKYQMIKNKLEYSDVLVKIADYSCSSCNMNIPHQVINEIRALKQVHTCQSCQRILYWSDGNEKNN